MLKLAGSILIIGTGILAGMSAADRIRQQYEEMRELQTLLYALRSEILYARACLGEAFLKIGRDAGEPCRGWMMEMSRKMERRQDRMLSVIWKTAVRDALKNSKMQKRDLLRLEELGTQLGDADLEAQIRSLDRYLEELKHSVEEIREGMKIKIRPCQCLGVMGGIFVTILLLKMLGITYVAEFSSAICKDAGYQTIAVQIEIFAKLAILVLSMPVLMALLSAIRDFLA